MDTSTQLVEEGNQHLNKLRISPAENNFEQALKQNPHSVGARIGLARIRLMKNQPVQATNFINEILEIQPENAEGLALKAVFCIQKSLWEEAVTYLEKAHKVDPELQMVHTNLAKSYRKLGDFQKAEEAAKTAIQLNPKNYHAHSELSAILLKTKRAKAGIQEMIKAIRINPFHVPGYLLLGRVFQASGKMELAIRIYKSGLKLNPTALPLREALTSSQR